MAINSDPLLRVSSIFDNDMDHPQFIDSSFSLQYLQAKLELYRELVIHHLFQRNLPHGDNRLRTQKMRESPAGEF
jgi:hypothetical protein